MRQRFLLFAIAFCSTFALLAPKTVAANPPMVVMSISKALIKFLSKEGSEEAIEYASKKATKDMVARVTASATREGGEETLEQVTKLIGTHGPDALRAFDNSPSLGSVLKALDEVPEAELKTALTKLAAGTTGRELAETIGKHGAKALTSELKHPGVGMALVRALGDDGAELASKMTADQAVTIGKRIDEIAKLPGPQRSGLLSMLKNDTDKLVRFVGDFTKANPGKTLFTVAATTVILSEPERILGGDEIVFDADGNPVVVSKKGIAGRTIEATGEAAKHVSEGYIQPVYYAVAAFLGTFFVLWLGIKLWHAHQREKLKTAEMLAEKNAVDDEAKTIEAKSVSSTDSAKSNTIASTSNSDAV